MELGAGRRGSIVLRCRWDENKLIEVGHRCGRSGLRILMKGLV